MTFLLGLVAGLIIGWVVEWIIDWQFWRSEADEAVTQERQLRQELAQAQAEISVLKQQFASPETPTSPQASVPTSPNVENLEVINGIGPEYAQDLRDAGIVTLADLAAATPAQLRSAIGVEAWQAASTEAWIAAAQSKLNQPNKGE